MYLYTVQYILVIRDEGVEMRDKGGGMRGERDYVRE